MKGTAPEPYDEPYRPQYHFSPPENWINDPNGLVYLDGEYHLFYQHNPSGDTWGNMSWGHAVSTDLFHWEHLPLALEKEEDLEIYSGSAVYDRENTSGLGTADNPPLVALYTGHHVMTGIQDQRLAYSLDKGRTWTKHEDNPVIDSYRGNFRDPKVFWHDQTSRWIMAVAMPTFQTIQFYSSPNLLDWKLESSFGPSGAASGMWECPDLFRLPVEGTEGEYLWVLQISLNPGAVAGGSGAQYLLGTFDGYTFTELPETEGEILWVDYGKDFYATQSFDNAPDGRRIWLAWMSNWEYAPNTPTGPWRGAMTVPRTVGLVDTPEGPRVYQKPVREIEALRAEHVALEDVTVSQGGYTPGELTGVNFELWAELDLHDAESCRIIVRKGNGEMTVIEYDVDTRQLRLDRTKSGSTEFNPEFADTIQTAPLEPQEGRITLRVLVDRSSVEVFANGGLVSMTDQIFPSLSSDGIEVFAGGGSITVVKLDLWQLESVW